MTKDQILLQTILSKNTFEYLLIDKNLKIIDTSKKITETLISQNEALLIGKDVLDFFPELFGFEDKIDELFVEDSQPFTLKTIYKNDNYIDISLEYYSNNSLLLLMQNVTEVTKTKQQILQDSNESLLFTNILQKTLDSQNTYIFLTLNNELFLANKKLLAYFDVKDLEEFKKNNINIYKYYDESCTSYEKLYDEIGHKEEYITINNDNFILYASSLESTYKIFTLTMITDLSRKLQYDPLTLTYKKEYLEKSIENCLHEGEHAAVVAFYIDNFKTILNDYGLKIGENILKEFSKLMKENIRNEDVFSRWTEEEFILLLKRTNSDESIEQVENIFKRIESHVFPHIKHFNFSVGMALIDVKDTLSSVLLRADRALYEAQKCEGNKLILKNLKKKK